MAGKYNVHIPAGAGRFAKELVGKLSHNKEAKQVGKFVDVAAKKTGQTAARTTRRQSKRTKYLGRTPGKTSRTGRQVQDRMRSEGLLKGTAPNVKVKYDGTWYRLDECDMGHSPVDAVRYWNSIGIQHGATSPEVRQWMLDPANYRLIPSSINRSEGARLLHQGHTYRDLP